MAHLFRNILSTFRRAARVEPLPLIGRLQAPATISRYTAVAAALGGSALGAEAMSSASAFRVLAQWHSLQAGRLSLAQAVLGEAGKGLHGNHILALCSAVKQGLPAAEVAAWLYPNAQQLTATQQAVLDMIDAAGMRYRRLCSEGLNSVALILLAGPPFQPARPASTGSAAERDTAFTSAQEEFIEALAVLPLLQQLLLRQFISFVVLAAVKDSGSQQAVKHFVAQALSPLLLIGNVGTAVIQQVYLELLPKVYSAAGAVAKVPSSAVSALMPLLVELYELQVVASAVRAKVPCLLTLGHVGHAALLQSEDSSLLDGALPSLFLSTEYSVSLSLEDVAAMVKQPLPWLPRLLSLRLYLLTAVLPGLQSSQQFIRQPVPSALEASFRLFSLLNSHGVCWMSWTSKGPQHTALQSTALASPTWSATLLHTWRVYLTKVHAMVAAGSSVLQHGNWKPSLFLRQALLTHSLLSSASKASDDHSSMAALSGKPFAEALRALSSSSVSGLWRHGGHPVLPPQTLFVQLYQQVAAIVELFTPEGASLVLGGDRKEEEEDADQFYRTHASSLAAHELADRYLAKTAEQSHSSAIQAGGYSSQSAGFSNSSTPFLTLASMLTSGHPAVWMPSTARAQLLNALNMLRFGFKGLSEAATVTAAARKTIVVLMEQLQGALQRAFFDGAVHATVWKMSEMEWGGGDASLFSESEFVQELRPSLSHFPAFSPASAQLRRWWTRTTLFPHLLRQCLLKERCLLVSLRRFLRRAASLPTISPHDQLQAVLAVAHSVQPLQEALQRHISWALASLFDGITHLQTWHQAHLAIAAVLTRAKAVTQLPPSDARKSQAILFAFEEALQGFDEEMMKRGVLQQLEFEWYKAAQHPNLKLHGVSSTLVPAVTGIPDTAAMDGDGSPAAIENEILDSNIGFIMEANHLRSLVDAVGVLHGATAPSTASESQASSYNAGSKLRNEVAGILSGNDERGHWIAAISRTQQLLLSTLLGAGIMKEVCCRWRTMLCVRHLVALFHRVQGTATLAMEAHLLLLSVSHCFEALAATLPSESSHELQRVVHALLQLNGSGDVAESDSTHIDAAVSLCLASSDVQLLTACEEGLVQAALASARGVAHELAQLNASSATPLSADVIHSHTMAVGQAWAAYGRLRLALLIPATIADPLLMPLAEARLQQMEASDAHIETMVSGIKALHRCNPLLPHHHYLLLVPSLFCFDFAWLCTSHPPTQMALQLPKQRPQPHMLLLSAMTPP